jgi:hypothetical protein
MMIRMLIIGYVFAIRAPSSTASLANRIGAKESPFTKAANEFCNKIGP